MTVSCFTFFIRCQILHSEAHSLDTFFERFPCIPIFAERCLPQKTVNSVNTYTKIGLVRNYTLPHTGSGRIEFLGGRIISEYPRCTYFALTFVK